jgi:hypothetical protein
MVVAIDDDSVTVRAFDANPVFVDGAAVEILRKYLVGRELITEKMWLKVRNYQPHEDGTQTWGIVERNGTISDTTGQVFAFYYGKMGGIAIETIGQAPYKDEQI